MARETSQGDKTSDSSIELYIDKTQLDKNREIKLFSKSDGQNREPKMLLL